MEIYGVFMGGGHSSISTDCHVGTVSAVDVIDELSEIVDAGAPRRLKALGGDSGRPKQRAV